MGTTVMTLRSSFLQLILLSSLALSQTAFSQETPESWFTESTKNLRELQKIQMMDFFKPLVERCKTEVPAIQDDIDSAFASLVKSMELALDQLIEEHKEDFSVAAVEQKGVNLPDPDLILNRYYSDVRPAIAEQSRLMVADLEKQKDIGAECRDVAAALRSPPAIETFRQQMESSFAQYVSRARAAQSQSQSRQGR